MTGRQQKPKRPARRGKRKRIGELMTTTRRRRRPGKDACGKEGQ